MGDIFHFDSDLAEKYGITEAIILYNLIFWLKKNKANHKHFYDSKYWTYNSVNAFSELFPFLSKDQIRRTLEKLSSKKAIETGNFNKIAYDRTNWYTLSDELYIEYVDNSHLAKMPNGVGENAKWIRQECQMDSAKMPNLYHILNTDVKKDKKTHTEKAENIKNLCVDIKNILGEKIGEQKVKDLVKKQGIEKINTYLQNWDKYKEHATSTQASFFIHCIENDRPVPPTAKQIAKKPQYANFEQREYKEEDFDKYCANLNM